MLIRQFGTLHRCLTCAYVIGIENSSDVKEQRVVEER